MADSPFITQDIVDPLKKAVASPLSAFLAERVGTGLLGILGN